MDVCWTATAEEHLDSIYAYISANSEEYALRMVDRLTSRSQQIAEHPQSGRRVPEFDLGQIRDRFYCLQNFRLIHTL
jgi:toxin ParE1/3/4